MEIERYLILILISFLVWNDDNLDQQYDYWDKQKSFSAFPSKLSKNLYRLVFLSAYITPKKYQFFEDVNFVSLEAKYARINLFFNFSVRKTILFLKQFMKF